MAASWMGEGAGADRQQEDESGDSGIMEAGAVTWH